MLRFGASGGLCAATGYAGASKGTSKAGSGNRPHGASGGAVRATAAGVRGSMRPQPSGSGPTGESVKNTHGGSRLGAGRPNSSVTKQANTASTPRGALPPQRGPAEHPRVRAAQLDVQVAAAMPIDSPLVSAAPGVNVKAPLP